jgi:hypothetical protein
MAAWLSSFLTIITMPVTADDENSAEGEWTAQAQQQNFLLICASNFEVSKAMETEYA